MSYAITGHKTLLPINKRKISAGGVLEVLAACKKKLTTAHACKNKHTARMLTNACKDHSIPLEDTIFISQLFLCY